MADEQYFQSDRYFQALVQKATEAATAVVVQMPKDNLVRALALRQDVMFFPINGDPLAQMTLTFPKPKG